MMRKHKKGLWSVVALASMLALSCFVGCGGKDNNKKPSADPTYTVTVTGGTASKTKAASGEVITLTATPKTGEELDKWVVKAGDVTVTDNKFTMPAKNVEIEAAFKKINYTVTVTGGTADKATATYGDTVTLTPDAAPAGKEFDTWKLNGTAIEGNSFKMPAANANVIAEYKNLSYAVTVTGGTADKAKAEAGETVTLTPNAAETGYEFKSWTVVAGGVTIADNAFTMPAAAVEVTAVFEKIDYTVTVTDGTADKTTANYGDTVTLTHDASAIPEGKEFGGWLVNDVFQEGNTFTMPAENVTVLPKYTGQQYTVTVTGGTANRTKAEMGEEITLTPAAAETGKEFKSWTVVAGGVTIAENKFTMPAGAVEVTAVFDFIDYTVTVTGGTADKTAAHYGDTVTLTIDASAVPTGKEFSAWKLNDEAIEGNTFTMPAANAVVTAEYANIRYNIIVEGGSADKAKAEMGETVTLTPATAEAGYEFKGWDLRLFSASEHIEDNTFVMPACNVTAVAVFEKIKYDIFVDGGTASPAKAAAGETVTLTPNAAPAGQEFKSWYVIAGPGNFTINADGTFVMPAEELEIEAEFGAIEYTITVTGGTANKAKAPEGEEITLTPEEKTGYNFTGWTVTAGEVTITENKFAMPAGAVSVEAQFEHVEYTITVEGEYGSVDKTKAYYGDTVTLALGDVTIPDGKEFYRWSVNGALQTESTFTMPAANVVVKAVIATHKKIATVDNSTGAYIHREGLGSGAVATDRGATAFTAQTDYVKYYIYSSADANVNTDSMGYIKCMIDPRSTSVQTAGWYKTHDDTMSVTLVGGRGNFYTPDPKGFFDLISYELGYKYGSGITYYFAVQSVAKADCYVEENGEWFKYFDSDISVIGVSPDEGTNFRMLYDKNAPSSLTTVTVVNGTVDGELTTVEVGFGKTITLNTTMSDTQLFAGWQIDGVALSYAYDYAYTVNSAEAVTITATFVDESSALVEKIATPPDSDKHISQKTPGGTVELDRMNGGVSTLFKIAKADYIKYWVYESSEVGSEPIGAFKFYMAPVPNGTKVAIVESLDGVRSYQIVEGNGGANPGNFYIATDVGAFFDLLKYALGGKYADGKEYFFAVQACTEFERTLLQNSEISAIATNSVRRSTAAVTECDVTVTGGETPVVTKAYVGSDFILDTEVPEGKIVRWYKVNGDAEEYLGFGNGIRVPVTGDTTFKYVIGDAVVAKKLATPDNTDNAMIVFKGATIEYDRQSAGTAFTEGVDYIIYHVYSDAAKTNHIGQFKIVRKADGFYLSACEGYGYFSDWKMTGNDPGNLYTSDGNAHNRIKEAIKGYNNDLTFYIACQAMSNTPEYEASEIGAVGGPWKAI